ncbi:unnamed protein product [Pleuronectes platessa]|uniref:Uncharacterized protein n=1 Tax=Pleuronectes platessa TaxID=8262 RepID=A0A9N7V4C6_PLEPL|nr:unnamed protein product [Pleuronectes platessa]
MQTSAGLHRKRRGGGGGSVGQKVSESSESFSVVPSLEGLEGFLGLRGARGPGAGPGPLPAGGGRCLSRTPGDGAPELQGEQKGIMEARMRARQSATSLLGAQARAGVRPEVERQREGGGRGEEGGREEEEEETWTRRKQGGEAGAGDKGTEQHSIRVQPADVGTGNKHVLIKSN